MRTVTVTGATGFVGTHVINVLRKCTSCHVIAAGRDEEGLRKLDTEYIVHDLNVEDSNCYKHLGRPDVLIHLAWEGLPNYSNLFHIERNLMNNYQFLKAMLQQGLPHLTVAGTCYEYGLHSGCLPEDTPTCPTTSYGVAKDSLRRFLAQLKKHYAFSLRWTRLFFMYGDNQNPHALIPQLDRALASGAESFDMSNGEQLRDYLPVEEAAALIVKVALQNHYDGIFNICSGNPISIRRLVEQRICERNGRISLNLGVFPYPEHEPMAYWGDTSRLTQTVRAFTEERGL